MSTLSDTDEIITPLSQNIDAVAALKMRAEQRVSRTQRAVETLTAYVARPHFFSASSSRSRPGCSSI